MTKVWGRKEPTQHFFSRVAILSCKSAVLNLFLAFAYQIRMWPARCIRHFKNWRSPPSRKDESFCQQSTIIFNKLQDFDSSGVPLKVLLSTPGWESLTVIDNTLVQRDCYLNQLPLFNDIYRLITGLESKLQYRQNLLIFFLYFKNLFRDTSKIILRTQVLRGKTLDKHFKFRREIISLEWCRGGLTLNNLDNRKCRK